MKKIRERKQWDIFVRVFHWSLVALVIGAFISSEDGPSIHITIGYAVLTLVGLRIVWGFIGTKHARFTDFVKGPGEVFSYLKGLFTGNPPEYAGHNPAGGAMIVAILATLIMVGYTGIMTKSAESGEDASISAISLSITSNAYADDDGERWKYEDEDDEHGRSEYGGHYKSHEEAGGVEGANVHGGSEELWEEVHEFFAGLLMVLVFVHVAAILLTWVVYGENLIRAMITGNRVAGEY